MRRAGRIVNEMEFRMLREAKSFSPPARVDTMKGFSPMRRLTILAGTPSSASSLRTFGCARPAFSKAPVC
jgi:hypothetical protein